MENWLVYAIIAALFSGIASFSQKIAVEKWVDALFLILANGIFMMVCSLIYILYTGESFSLGGSTLFILTILCVLAGLQVLNTRVRAEVLKYLSSSEYFVSVRILTTAILTVFWIFIFREYISHLQFIGLIIWSCGIILLFEEDTRLQHSRNWARAIYLLFVSIMLGATIQIAAKYATLETGKIAVMLFYEGIFMLMFFFMFYWSRLPIIIKSGLQNKNVLIATIFWSSIYLSIVCNFTAFAFNGPVGIVLKIIGYSIFIPIILSMIFYREKLSIKKWIAFVLTIISIYYLN